MPFIEIVNEYTLKVHFDPNNIMRSADQISGLQALIAEETEKILDLIPAYASLTIILDGNKTLPQTYKVRLEKLLTHIDDHPTLSNAREHELPCYYGEEYAWDLARISEEKQLPQHEIISAHTAKTYRVYALGFSPGFPYLGFVDKKIACARLSKPRTKVPKGAVAIAENQTGIYPQESPGGWNIIGCCPTPLFNPKVEPELSQSTLSTLQVGDYVRFKPITKAEFIHFGGTLDQANFTRASQ